MAKKKTSKKPRARLVSMDDVYRLLNRVQLGEKKIKFAVSFDDGDTAENVIKDTELPYERNNLKTRVSFIVQPDPEKNYGDELLEIDFFFDELDEFSEEPLG